MLVVTMTLVVSWGDDTIRPTGSVSHGENNIEFGTLTGSCKVDTIPRYGVIASSFVLIDEGLTKNVRIGRYLLCCPCMHPAAAAVECLGERSIRRGPEP